MDIADLPELGHVSRGALAALLVTFGTLWIPGFRMLVLTALVFAIGAALAIEGPERALLWVQHVLAETGGAGLLVTGIAAGSAAAILASWWLARRQAPETLVSASALLWQVFKVTLGVIVVLMISAVFVRTTRDSLPSGPELRRFFDAPTLLLFTDGSGQRQRDCICYYPLRAQDLPQSARAVLTASEDRRFDLHSGVDYVGLARAVLAQLAGSHQGGSTISHQLAKSIVGDERSILRKLREMVLAWQIEQVFSKEEILVYHLNRSYFGRGAYGLGEAARVYFHKRARDLNTYEMAALVGMLPSPERNSKRPDLAAEWVLTSMVAAGRLTTAKAKRVLREGSRPGTLARFDFHERFYLDAAEEAAAKILPATRAGTWRISLG